MVSLLVFFATPHRPSPSTSWDGLARWVLLISSKKYANDIPWISKTSQMMRFVNSAFESIKNIYKIINVHCAATGAGFNTPAWEVSYYISPRLLMFFLGAWISRSMARHWNQAQQRQARRERLSFAGRNLTKNCLNFCRMTMMVLLLYTKSCVDLRVCLLAALMAMFSLVSISSFYFWI